MKDKKNKNFETTSNSLKSFAIITVCIVVLFLCVYACTYDSTDSTEYTKEELKSMECRNRSNTYYKCSWNVWEDRCTCKQR